MEDVDPTDAQAQRLNAITAVSNKLRSPPNAPKEAKIAKDETSTHAALDRHFAALSCCIFYLAIFTVLGFVGVVMSLTYHDDHNDMTKKIDELESGMASIARCMARIPNFDIQQCAPPLSDEEVVSGVMREMAIKLHRDQAYERFRTRKDASVKREDL